MTKRKARLLPMSVAEVRARKEVATRLIDEVRTLFDEGDPVGNPVEFNERGARALAIQKQLEALFPFGPPPTAEEQERLERNAAQRPDAETMRGVYLEIERMAVDPNIPAELREAAAKVPVRDALDTLDQIEQIQPVLQSLGALLEHIARGVPDATSAAVRKETRKRAAKIRS